MAHAFEDECAIAGHALGAALERSGEDGGELGALLAADAARRDSVVVLGGRLHAIDAGTPFDHVEIELENALLAEDEFGDGDECGLRALAEDGAAGSEEEVLDELLRDGRATADASAFHVFVGSKFHGLPIEAMVLVEARVLGGDDGVLEVGRDLAQWNELVVLVVGLAVNEGLEAALDVDSGGGRVDESGGDESERGGEPGGDEAEADGEKDGADEGLGGTLAARGCGLWRGEWVGGGGHLPE